MTQSALWEKQVARNSGLGFEMKKGQAVKITAAGVVDFVVFNRHNLRERFDQARCKANQKKLFLSTGDILISKINNTMMTIVEDTYTIGHHDLQSGGCSKKRWELLRASGQIDNTYGRKINPDEIPNHGCWENLADAVKPWGIDGLDLPSPFNIFQDMHLDGKTGSMEHSMTRPEPGMYVTLRAEMDLLAALSVCPDFTAIRPDGGVITLLPSA